MFPKEKESSSKTVSVQVNVSDSTYHKVSSSRPSHLVTHFKIFGRPMKGKFDNVTFGQEVPKLNSRLLARYGRCF